MLQVENTSSELVFDEFEEVVVRLFNGSAWLQSQALGDSAALLDQDGDGDLDEDDIDDLFDECDVDGSGSISLEELSGALGKRLNAAAAQMVASKLVAIADEDQSGSMSRDELKLAIRNLMSEKKNEAEATGGAAFERAFEEWLRKSFLPPALRAAAKKKLLR